VASTPLSHPVTLSITETESKPQYICTKQQSTRILPFIEGEYPKGEGLAGVLKIKINKNNTKHNQSRTLSPSPEGEGAGGEEKKLS
jgi:hypothetical protein